MNIENIRDEIIEMYVNSGMSTVEIAREVGCSNSGIGRLLNRNGICLDYKARMGYLSESDIDRICEDYSSGKTTKEIGLAFNLCDATIAKVIRRKGITIRPAKRRSNVQNHSYFRNIDTIGKAYFLGWMISDGAIIRCETRPNRARVISLEIKDTDSYILKMFARELGASDDIVKVFEKRGHSYIRFSSDEMADDLARYGVVERKSKITYLPMIREDLMPHMIRGIFDGDGTVTTDKNGNIHFAFYGSEKLCTDIRNYLHDKIGLNKNKVSKSTCYHVWWGGIVPPKIMSEYMYSNCGEFVLERKKQRLTQQ